MGFLKNLFASGPQKESVILFDIGVDSVAAAYAVHEKGKTPLIAYAKRFPVAVRLNEQTEHAVLRALNDLGSLLLTEGAPALARISGSGRAGSISLAFDPPWQKSTVRVDHFEKSGPFVFSKEYLKEATKNDGELAPGKLLIEEHVIGTLLNGYQTQDPYGKKVHRAAVVVMASLIDDRIARYAAADLRKLFHTEQFRIWPGSALRLEAMRLAFPHQKDALIIDANAPEPSAGLIRHGWPAAIEQIAPARLGWTAPLVETLANLSKRYPLPRTIFLLTNDLTAALEKSLAAPPVRKLWLSEDPLKIVLITARHLSPLVRLADGVEPDLKLLLMALYHQAGD